VKIAQKFSHLLLFALVGGLALPLAGHGSGCELK
jgi:hypothetical protein